MKTTWTKEQWDDLSEKIMEAKSQIYDPINGDDERGDAQTEAFMTMREVGRVWDKYVNYSQGVLATPNHGSDIVVQGYPDEHVTMVAELSHGTLTFWMEKDALVIYGGDEDTFVMEHRDGDLRITFPEPIGKNGIQCGKCGAVIAIEEVQPSDS